MNGSHQESKVGCSRLYRECGRLDLAQPGGLEQLGQVALAGAGEVGLIVDVGVELTRGVPEEPEGALAPTVIPDARRDDTIPPGHAGHLGQPRDRVLHEVDDELREGRVERVVREWQPLGWRLSNIDARMARPRRGDERLGWVDGRHRCRSQPRDQLGRERAGAAADVENPLPAADRGETCQLTGQQARVPTHEVVVGLGGDIEAHVPKPSPQLFGGNRVHRIRARRKASVKTNDTWDLSARPRRLTQYLRARGCERVHWGLARREGVGRARTTSACVGIGDFPLGGSLR